MASRLLRLTAALAVLAAGSRPARAQAAGAGREVVSREMIEEAGLLRLGEVVRLAPSWHVSTVDDFTWRAAPRGLAPPVEDTWVLLVDGREMELGALGTASLERLPLDLAAIDSIVFDAAPAVVAGTFAPAGSIHIHTHRPERAFARARLGFGSETGDPGPFTFLPGGRSNRDRYGHESAVEAGFRRGGWYGAASYAASVHLPTDPLILPRMDAASPLTPRIERMAPSLRLGFADGRSHHHILAGMSRLDDRHRLELAGIEVPVRTDMTHLSASGALTGSGFELGYRAGLDRSQIASDPTATAPRFEYDWRVFRGSLEAMPAGGAYRIGMSLVHRSGLGSMRDHLGGHTGLGIFGTLSMRPGGILRQEVAVALSGRGEGIEGGVVVASALATGKGQLSLRLSAGRMRAMQSAGQIELAALGEPWLARAGIPAELPPPDHAAWLAEAELGWNGPSHGRMDVDAAAYVRAYDGALTLERELDWDPAYRAWRGPVRVREAAGRTAGGRLRIRHAVSRRLETTAHIDVAKPFGDSLFRRVAAPVPQLRAVASISWRPVAGFGLRTEIEVESAREWPDHAAVGAAPAKARAIQPAAATLSVGAWKTFLDGRLRGQFAARNLTGRRVILHPDGRASTLAFLFLLGASF
ncbi:MAG: TonB-dependent receptor [Gemmatimonadota bacterium]